MLSMRTYDIMHRSALLISLSRYCRILSFNLIATIPRCGWVTLMHFIPQMCSHFIPETQATNVSNPGQTEMSNKSTSALVTGSWKHFIIVNMSEFCPTVNQLIIRSVLWAQVTNCIPGMCFQSSNHQRPDFLSAVFRIIWSIRQCWPVSSACSHVSISRGCQSE